MADQAPGGFDLGALLAQAQNMQQQLQAAQEEAAEAEVVGQAGGGAVRITATGGFEFLAVKIDPSAVDPDEVEMLEDLILAALNDAMGQVADLQEGAGGGAGGGLGGLGDMLGGLDLGGLGGLLGGLAPSSADADPAQDDDTDEPG